MFEGIVGNKRAVGLLEDDLKNGSVSHAYIFSGPSNVGKSTVAHRFAKNIMCGCGDCRECTLLDKRSHPDLHVLLGDESIKIDEARAMQRFLSMKPHQSERKVVVIENAERMTREAANSLLKILEEPSGNSVMILTTSDKSALLETVLSRCRLINFTLASDADILGLAKDKRMALGGQEDFFRGKPGLLLGSLTLEGSFENAKEVFGMLPSFFRKGGYKAKFDIAKKMGESSDLPLILDSLSLVFRDILLYVSHCKEEAEITSFDIKSCGLKTENVAEILGMIEKIKKNINKGVNTKLFLENLILKMEGV